MNSYKTDMAHDKCETCEELLVDTLYEATNGTEEFTELGLVEGKCWATVRHG